jgi:alpha-tubulin suppressor-like RCC1 family protein
VASDNTVWCWGVGDYHVLGNNSTTDQPTPVQVPNVSNAVQVSGGDTHTVILDRNGGVAAWGWNGEGAIGDGTFMDRPTVTNALVLTFGVIEIESGGDHVCARTASRAVFCWGFNDWGELGLTGPSRNQPTANGQTADQVAPGSLHTCAREGAAVRCWGRGDFYELGDGDPRPMAKNPTPVTVMGVSSATDLSGGPYHTCAVSGGRVYCWGWNSSGELGDGSTMYRTSAFAVPGLTGAVAVSAGGNEFSPITAHTCALVTGGDVYCWGAGAQGQLGNGASNQSGAPVRVTMGGFVQISAGGFHTCGRRGDGSIWCWGDGARGRLGDGRATDSNVPVRVTGF